MLIMMMMAMMSWKDAGDDHDDDDDEQGSGFTMVGDGFPLVMVSTNDHNSHIAQIRTYMHTH